VPRRTFGTFLPTPPRHPAPENNFAERGAPSARSVSATWAAATPRLDWDVVRERWKGRLIIKGACAPMTRAWRSIAPKA
jgi:hypothetical protein